MGRTCSICKSDKRALIDERIVAHVPMMTIASENGFGYGAIYRHSKHLGTEILKQYEACEMERNESLIDQVRQLVTRCQALADESRASKDRRSAILALREVSRNLELLAQMTGVLEGTRLNVQFNQVNVNAIGGESPDSEIARLIAQVTNNFDDAEIARYKALASLESRTISGHGLLSGASAPLASEH